MVITLGVGVSPRSVVSVVVLFAECYLVLNHNGPQRRAARAPDPAHYMCVDKFILQ